MEKRILNKLAKLHDEDMADEYFELLIEFLKSFRDEHEFKRKRKLTNEKDVILITYGDQIKKENNQPLQVLKNFLDKYFKETINTVHILPFFPYSSDYGFSIIDYTSVNSDFGSWDDIENIKGNFKLMVDLVLNHISRESNWFQEFLKGNPKYKDYFITVDKSEDLSEVVRPRAKPLLTKVEINNQTKYVWTTFSEDQIDLNYKNPDVLMEMIKILLLYIDKGARYLRLDAIAYVWKEIGTSCIHLEQDHIIVKLFRDILDYIAPEVKIITETNVPHKENISYFGDGHDEAQLVYQFPLPPLILFSFIKENTRKLRNWAKILETPTKYTNFFNFTASHDGIGVRPVENILSKEGMQSLLDHTLKNKGYISYKKNSDGSKSPYELNISYFNAIVGDLITKGDRDSQVKKFMASQAIQISLAGVPGIYFHSLVGTRNYYQGVEKTGEYRSINRRKYKLERLLEKINDKNSITSKVYNYYIKLLNIRISEKAFNPNAKQKIIDIDERLFSLMRISTDEEQIIIIIINVSSETINVGLNLKDFSLPKHINLKKLKNLINKEEISTTDNVLDLDIKPYEINWMTNS
ncbi:MAG: sugar phosphorylase [Candidatus Lokiarchaeota archaeon]|nr:sugar phosphorylase [Candidatus Lokiarchaeota archaeon]